MSYTLQSRYHLNIRRGSYRRYFPSPTCCFFKHIALPGMLNNMHKTVSISMSLVSQAEPWTLGMLWVSLEMLMTAVSRTKMDPAETSALTGAAQAVNGSFYSTGRTVAAWLKSVQIWSSPTEFNVHQIIKSFRLKKTFKIIESKCWPSTANSNTKPCPQGPYLHIF